MVNDGFIGLLGLKKEAVVGIDGQTIFLKTDDFVGINKLEDSYHLVSVRSNPNATIAVGVVLCSNAPTIVKRYDEQTEEISAQNVDDLTATNLSDSVAQNRLPKSSVVDYEAIVSPDQVNRWKNETAYIGSSDILKLRGLSHGDKIIPGSYQEEMDETLAAVPKREQTSLDGKYIQYPGIPVVDVALSMRTSRHNGTRRYLATKTPAARTKLFLCDSVAGMLLDDVLTEYYSNSWKNLLSDMQLAYSMFLYLQCLSSLEHWKDLVAMLSLVPPSAVCDHSELYAELLEVLALQVSTIDTAIIEDTDEIGCNFLVPSLKKLCRALSDSDQIDDNDIGDFERLLSSKFPSFLIVTEPEEDMEEHAMRMMTEDDEEDDSDAPVVVGAEEIQASMARSSAETYSTDGLSMDVRTRFPLLVAAMQPHEDILMTCARALDAKLDVSVVREAAAYLQEVERQG